MRLGQRTGVWRAFGERSRGWGPLVQLWSSAWRWRGATRHSVCFGCCRKFDVGQLSCGAGEHGGLRQTVEGFSDTKISHECAPNPITNETAESRIL